MIVIGGGPAAMSAVLYLSQLNRKVAWIFGYGLGGQIQITETIENYLGFQNGMASNLLLGFAKQTENLTGVEKIFGMVEGLTKKDGIFTATTDLGEKYFSKTALVATGASPKTLGVKGEEDFTGRGVSYCAICDAPLYKDKKVLVVGGGQSAFENTEILSRFAKNVILIHRSSNFKANKKLVERVSKIQNVEILTNRELASINGDISINSVEVKHCKTKEIELIKVDGVFVSIGQKPATEFLDSLNLGHKIFPLIEEDGYMDLAFDNEAMWVEGLFGAGDVVKGVVKQVIVAAGDGASAAVNIDRFLSEK